MGQVVKDLKPLLDHRMALQPLDMGNEAHATGVVFIGRVVEPLRQRKVGISHVWTFRKRVSAAALEDLQRRQIRPQPDLTEFQEKQAILP